MSFIVPFNEKLSELVASLVVEDEQREFIGDFSSTLNDISQKLTGHVILYDGIPAGFFIIDLDYPNQYNFSTKGSVGLRSFFIANQFQGKGLAKHTLQELSSYLRSQGFQAEKLFLTVNCRNMRAAALYRKCGFCDEGKLYLGGPRGPQHIMQMSIT
jgi:ribosomal protein S18 acetylase RimI-like enzyme